MIGLTTMAVNQVSHLYQIKDLLKERKLIDEKGELFMHELVEELIRDVTEEPVDPLALCPDD